MKITIDKSEFKRKAFNIALALVLTASFIVTTMFFIAIALMVEAS